MIDDRDDILEGFACCECGEPFNDGVGHRRACKACGGTDESRHDQFKKADPPIFLGVPLTWADFARVSADGP